MARETTREAASGGRASRGRPPAGRRAPARRGDGDRLRDEIVEAAITTLAETGDPRGLSLRGVARGVGVAATSIYLHFPDLDTLLLEVKQLLFVRLTRVLVEAMDAAGEDPHARVRAGARAYVRFGTTDPGLYRSLFDAPMLSPHVLPRGDFIGRDAFDTVAAAVAAIVGERDAPLVTTHVWTALHGLVTLRATRNNFAWPDLDEEVDDLMARLVRAGDPGE